MLTRITKSTATLVSLNEIRSQCRIDDDNNLEDALLMGYVRTAQDWIEEQLGVALLTSIWEARFAGFPSSYTRAICLPIGPLQSVDQITYLDPAGVTQILPDTDYTLASGKIWPAYGLGWPAVRSPSDTVVAFTAGYGDDHNSVPEPIRQATMLLAAYYQGQREAVLLGPDTGPASGAPFGVRQLLQPYRAWSF